MLRRLEEGELRGIASVGVLGEGFDLPKRKISVYHQRHTLQDWQLTQGGTMMLLDSGPADLADMELMVEAIDASSYRIRFEFDGVVVCSTIIDISGRAHADGLDPIVVTPDGEMALTEALSEWPHCTCFADGSSVYGSVRFPGPQELQAVPPEVPSRLNWADVDIRRESKPGRDGRSNIQQRMVDWAHEMQPDVVIVDDSANELADVVAVHRAPTGSVVVTFIHCKWSSEVNRGSALSMYMTSRVRRTAQRAGVAATAFCTTTRAARAQRSLIRGWRCRTRHRNHRRTRGTADRGQIQHRDRTARSSDRRNRSTRDNQLTTGQRTDWIRSQGADLVLLGT